MPAPFFYFSYYSPAFSFFYKDAEEGYICSYSNESKDAEELSFYLLQELRKKNNQISFYSQEFRKNNNFKGSSVLRVDTDAELKKNASFKSKKLILSLEKMGIFDEFFHTLGWRLQFNAISFFLEKINNFLSRGYTVGINFREVFLVPVGKKPPAHFRPDIDIQVSSDEEYKKNIELFSYQLGKAIFKKLHPIHSKTEKSTLALIKNYTDNFQQKGDEYSTPIKELHYYNSAFTRHFSHFSGYTSVIYAFTNPVSISDLTPIFSFNYLDKELVFIFKGAQYENAAERQKIYTDILTLIRKNLGAFHAHFFLITQEEVTSGLLDLIPSKKLNGEDFYPLQGVGYYLSSADISSFIYYHMQKMQSTSNPVLTALEAIKAQSENQIAPKAQFGAYIQTQRASKDARKSKTLTTLQLKSKVQLNVEHQETNIHQENSEQAQSVKEQVNTTQALQANQSLKDSITFTTGDTLLDLEELCKILRILAKDNLSHKKRREDLLKQAGYLTQFYLDNHSQCHFYEQLLSEENFCLQIAARILGCAFLSSKSNSESATIVKLPDYSVEKINKKVPVLLFSQHGWDLHPHERHIKEEYSMFGTSLGRRTLSGYDLQDYKEKFGLATYH